MIEIKNRFTGAIIFECELTAEIAAGSAGLQLGFAVRMAAKADADLSRAYLSRADLSRADLTGANLAGAYLTGANLTGANLIDGGQRSDEYRFVGQVKDGALWIAAGCRYFPVADARAHWTETRGGTKLGAETMAILDHIEAVARIRGLIKEPVQ